MTPTAAAQPSALCACCESDSRHTPATLLLDDAPYCLRCANTLNFSSAEITIGARAFLCPPERKLEARQEEMRERQQPKPKDEVKTKSAWCGKCHKIKIKDMSRTGKCSPCQMGLKPDHPKRLEMEARDAGLPCTHEPKVEDVIYNLPPVPADARDAQIPQETHSAGTEVQTNQPEEETAYEPRVSLSVTNYQIDRMFAGLPLSAKAQLVQKWLDMQDGA
jgi:hypothetical protein